MSSHPRNARLFVALGFSRRTAGSRFTLLVGATLLVIAGIQRESVALTGGPDAFGYTFIDSNEPGGPTYNFEDISATGTPITLGDDQTGGPFPLGFTFSYYGTNYTAVYVSSNGWITVLAPGTSGVNPARLPTAATPNAVIAGWWHDLDPPEGGSIRYQTLGSAPNRRFIVQFTNIQHFPSGNPCTFQWKLFERSNRIEIHYSAAPSDGAAHAVGIENQTGTVGLEYFYGNTALSTPLAVRFKADDLDVTGADLASVGPQGGPFNPSFTTYALTNRGTSSLDWKTSWTQPWIAATPSSGTLAAGTSTTVQVSFNAAANSLASGTYTATVTFTNVTSGRTFLPRTVRLTVLEHLQVLPPDGFHSAGLMGGAFTPSSTTYALTNIGPAPVNWTTSKTAVWFDVVPASGALSPGTSRTVTIALNASAAGLPGGIHSDILSFTNTGSGITTTRSITLAVQAIATLPFFDGFETGTIGLFWLSTGTNEYRTTVTLANGPHTGSYHLTMDDRISGSQYSRNELTLAIDLSRAENVQLSFWMKSFGDENDGPPPSPFFGGADFDGVAVSADGNAWYEVLGLRNQSGAYHQLAVDLDAAVASLGLSYNGKFRIRFNHYDNYPIPTDGFAFDDISVTGTVDVLMVSPPSAFEPVGPESGPFVPVSKLYTLTNTGLAPLNWTAAADVPWISLTGSSGTLAPGTSTTVNVALNANAYSLAVGSHSGTVTFTNTTSGKTRHRDVTLTVLERLTVSPADAFVSAGTPGGPFVPASRTYTLTNTGLTPFNWVALETADWVDVTPWYGTLAPLTSATVAVSIAAPARTLAAGQYTTTVAFLDIDSGNALGRNVVLRVHGGPVVDLDAGFATSPLTRIYGDDPGDYLGSDIADGIAYGDVNGDGYDDLIIGANIRNFPGGPQVGGVYVIYGSASLPARTIDLNTNGAISGTSETRILGDDPGDGAGFSVASGDVNGDGYDDVIIGAPLADPPGGVDAGEVYILYGSPSLPGRIIDLNTSGAISAAGETRILGDDAGDRAGLAVASGDVNGDGYDDVIIGAPDADPPGGTTAGEVYVICGSATLSSSTIDLNTNGAISAAGETRILGDDAGDEAGWPVASGDINGDGYDDIIIAVWAGDPPGGAGAGEVYVVYGSATLSSATLDLNTNGAISPWGETRILGDDAGDGFGWLVDAGDVNRDGYDDVIVGAPIANPPGGARAGEVYVVYGSATLSSATLDLNTDGAISRWGETRILGDDAGDNAGYSVGCGDINGDGYDDVILGAPAAGPPGSGLAGEVYVIHGSTRLSSSTVDLNTTWGDLRVLGDNPNDQFGYSGEAGPGDLDRNGFADLTAAARLGDNPSIGGNNDSGYAAIVFGQGPATSATVTEHFKAGIAPKRGFGGRLSPVARTWLSFDGGTSAPATVTLNRSKTGIIHLGNGSLMDVANVVWQLTTPRTGFRSAEVTLQYTDSESPGGDLALYQAPTLYGPWTEVTTQTLDTQRNTITATVTGFSYFALLGEQVRPNVTVNQAAGQRDPTSVFPIRFSVVFNESVVGFNAGDVTMGGTATGVTFNVTGSGASYTIAVTGATGDGTIAPQIAAGVCQDLRGNFSNASTSTDNRVTLDRVRPTAVMSSTASNPTNTSPILVTVTFSKPVTGFAASDVVTSNAVVRSFSGTGANYAVALAPTGPGLVTADIPATAAHDVAGNDNLAAAQFRRTFDNVRPTVAWSSAVPDPTNLLFIAVTVVFSEPVTGFDASDLMVSNATVIGLWGSGTDYIVFLIPQGAGLITVNIAAGAAHDAAGNGNAMATPFSLTFDNVPPRLTGLTVRHSMSLQVVFNESVRNADQASNFSCTGGLTIVGATRQSDTQYLLTTTEQRPGTSYTLTAGNGVTDRAGNPIDADFRSRSFGGGAPTAARPAWPLYR